MGKQDNRTTAQKTADAARSVERAVDRVLSVTDWLGRPARKK